MPSPTSLLNRMLNIPVDAVTMAADTLVFDTTEAGCITGILFSASVASTVTFRSGTSAAGAAIFTIATSGAQQFFLPLPHPFVVYPGQGLFVDYITATPAITLYYKKL